MNNYHALVIEDEAYLADIFSEAMIGAGFTPEIISHGGVAQQRLKEIVPDLVVLDLHLPEVDGVHLLTQIREDPRLQNTITIIATADHNLSLTLREKATLVLLKPISFVQLRDLTTRLRGLIQRFETIPVDSLIQDQ